MLVEWANQNFLRPFPNAHAPHSMLPNALKDTSSIHPSIMTSIPFINPSIPSLHIDRVLVRTDLMKKRTILVRLQQHVITVNGGKS